MTSSALAQLPSWAPPATPELTTQSIGLNRDGELYIYGPTPAAPGPTLPSIVGLAVDLEVVQLAATDAAQGGRDYLRLTLMTGLPGERLALQLPCNERISPTTGQTTTPSHVRSLLSGLQRLDLVSEAFKLQTKRGTRAYAGVFFRVIPIRSGEELPEVITPILGRTRNDLEIAVNGLRQALGLPPQFTSPHDELQS